MSSCSSTPEEKFSSALKTADLELLNQAISEGYDINSVDKNGSSCLFDLVSENKYPLIEELIKFGIEVNQKNNSGETSIFYASKIPVFNLLVNNGANLNIKNNKGQTLLIKNVIEENEEIINILLETEDFNLLEKDSLGKSAIDYTSEDSPLQKLILEKQEKIKKIKAAAEQKVRDEKKKAEKSAREAELYKNGVSRYALVYLDAF